MTRNVQTDRDLGKRPIVLVSVDQEDDFRTLQELIQDTGFRALRADLSDGLSTPQIPLLLISGKPLSEDEEVKILQTGVKDILYWPMSSQKLLLKLKVYSNLQDFHLEISRPLQSRVLFEGMGEIHHIGKEIDWSTHVLGPVESWPQCLKTAFSIMLASQFPMVIAWGEKRIFFYNDAYIPILGKKHPDAFGKPFEEVWSEIWEYILPLVQSVDNGKAIYLEDLPFSTTRNGRDEIFYATFSYSPIRDEFNRVAGLFCAVVETTSRKHSDDALKASELSLLDTLESMSDAFLSLNKDWLITRVNKRYEVILQHTRSETMGQEFLSAKLYQNSIQRESYLEAMDKRVEMRFDDFIQPLDLWIDVRIFPKQDGGLAIFFSDITERKVSELQAVHAKIKFEQSVDVSPAILWITEEDGKCTYLSKQWYEFTGQTESEALGYGWLDATHPDDKERAGKAFTDANARREYFYVEYRLKTKNGDYRWAIDAGNPRYDESGNYIGYAGTVFDINERRNAESELEKAKDEAEYSREQAERANALKSAFLANMSHEIRTPLGAILGFTNLLKDKSLDSFERDQYLETIVRNGNALSRIIDDILDLAKVEAGRLDIEEVSFILYKVVSEAVELFKDKTKEKGIYLHLNIEESVPTIISSDPTRLRQILINLIGNAVKFTDQGGVSVNVRAMPIDFNRVKVSIDVKDTGIGLTQAQQEKLFTPFTQADNSTTRKFGGTGLGLALSQRLSQALSGEISITEYTLGEGCTFTFHFIAKLGTAKSDATLHASAPKSTKTLSLEGKRVLIVDDSPDNQFLAARILGKSGAKVETASDGDEGVKAALSSEFDVILMDIQMPKLDGYQAKEALDTLGYQRPIVALTAHAMADERQRTKAAGFAAHLTKPIDGVELLETLASLLNR
ncbi:MAG: ATP-binding protein [Bdellovibrionota bacterium]